MLENFRNNDGVKNQELFRIFDTLIEQSLTLIEQSA